MTDIAAEACACHECDGQGGYDVWKAVDGHYEGGEVFRVQCDQCDGTGKVDGYGNPFSGDRIIYCCFPDCGCDGARLCQAEKGASGLARSLNLERGTMLQGLGIARQRDAMAAPQPKEPT